MEAEEIVQGVFLTFWEKRHRIEIHTSIHTYLFRMVRNTSLNTLKHAKIKQKHACEELASSSEVSESVSQTILSNELQERIGQAIEKLPEQCRLVFKLSRFEELKYAEIATQLNISVKTVENQIGKALKIMREQLHEYLPLIFAVLFDLL
jgi:RNA polymerase sigma-70 factor, ECF subfamily